jgi:hypothetical protein
MLPRPTTAMVERCWPWGEADMQIPARRRSPRRKFSVGQIVDKVKYPAAACDVVGWCLT